MVTRCIACRTTSLASCSYDDLHFLVFWFAFSLWSSFVGIVTQQTPVVHSTFALHAGPQFATHELAFQGNCMCFVLTFVCELTRFAEIVTQLLEALQPADRVFMGRWSTSVNLMFNFLINACFCCRCFRIYFVAGSLCSRENIYLIQCLIRCYFYFIFQCQFDGFSIAIATLDARALCRSILSTWFGSFYCYS